MPRRNRALLVVVLALLLSACPAPRRPAPEAPPPERPVAAPSFPGTASYRVVADESLVRILAFRGGKMASAGHNHVIASRNLGGTVYVHEEATRSGFQIVMPVPSLELDDAKLRSEEGAEFASEVSETAKEGTRKNLQSAALLDGEHYPSMTLTSLEISGTREQMQARTQVLFKDRVHELTIPVSVEYQAERVIASGEFAVKQSELGLAPYSVMLGALQVQDELKVKFRIVAKKE